MPDYYILKPSNSDLTHIHDYMNKYSITYDVALFFYYRGKTPEEYLTKNESEILSHIDSYLNSKYNIKQISAKFIDIIKNSKNILIYSDYDADGITANTIMTKFLKRLQLNSNIKSITSERKYGYGMNLEYIKNVYKEFPYDTVIALDHGGNNPNIIIDLKQNGIKSIVIDHHILEDNIVSKQADLLFHPGDDNISSGGLSFLLTYIVAKTAYPQYLPEVIKLSQFATISQITDVIEFDHINYLIAKLGYPYLNDTNNNNSIKQYYTYYKKNDKINTEELKFYLGPILNAASRLGNANASLQYMLEENEGLAKEYLKNLIAINKERKSIQDNIVNNIKSNKQCIELMQQTNIITVLIQTQYDEIKNKGVIGSIASSLTNTFNLPSIILTKHNNIISGSCRGTDQFPIYPIIKKYKHLLLGGGGHKYAAGLSVTEENLPRFINAAVNEVINKKIEKICNAVEILKSPNNVDAKTLELFDSLEPFGNRFEALSYGFVDKIKDINSNKKNANLNHFYTNNLKEIKFIAYNLDTNLFYLQHNNRDVLITYNYANSNKKQMFINDITDNFEEIEINNFIKKRNAQLDRFDIQNNCTEEIDAKS